MRGREGGEREGRRRGGEGEGRRGEGGRKIGEMEEEVIKDRMVSSLQTETHADCQTLMVG